MSDASEALNRAAAHVAGARSAVEAAATAGAPADSARRATEHLDNAGRQLLDALQGIAKPSAARFDEEKPPTPAASRYEPESE